MIVNRKSEPNCVAEANPLEIQPTRELDQNKARSLTFLRSRGQGVFSFRSRSGVWKSITYIFSGNVITTGITLITSILVARWVLPSQMGIWNAARAILPYISFLHLGVFSGLSRELPFYIGKGLKDEAVALAETSLAWAFCISVFISVGSVAAWAWLLAEGKTELAWAVFALGVTLGLGFISQHFSATYKSHLEFSRLAQRSVLVSLLGLPLLGFVWAFNYWGFLLKYSLLQVGSLLILVVKPPLPVRPRWDNKRLGSLIKTGIPISVVGNVVAALKTLDVLALTRFGGTELVGQYTIALQVTAAAGILPMAFVTVVYPTMSHRYGQTGYARPIFWLSVKAAMGVLAAGMLIAVVGWLTVPILIPVILPRYTMGIPAAQWSTLIVLFSALTVVESVFNVLKKQQFFILAALLNVLAFVLSWLWLAKGQTGSDLLVATAQANLIGLGVRSLASLLFAFWICYRHDRALDAS